LLVVILLLLIISPIAAVFDDQDNLISPLMAVVLLAVTFGAAEKKRTAWCMAGLIVVWLVISVLTDGSGLFAGQSLLAPLLFLLLLGTIFIFLARWLVRAVRIDAEVLCAAICGYLIIGILWAGLYAVVLVENPKALVSPGSTEPQIDLGGMLYFSYATLTTTGFGDIIPKSPLVRMLAVTEAIVGIFYNTIVIARFVGLYGLKTSGPGAPSN
jgi:hypothetical protein